MTRATHSIVEYADMLYRTAAECHRQHTRHAKMVARSAAAEEQVFALEMAFLCDDMLGTAITAYEKCTSKAKAQPDDAWWHKANMLWHSSREYIRRHANCDGMSKRLAKGAPNRLGELAMEFDLEASALLSLKMAADAYKAVRPEAD